MNIGASTIAFNRRRLPHWLVADHAYFVTLCRKGSLPVRVAAELRAEREIVARDLRDHAADAERSDTPRSTGPRPTEEPAPVARNVSDRADIGAAWEARHLAARRRRFLEIDAMLDADARSRRDLCVPEVASVILDNLDWLRSVGYTLHNPVKAGLCATWRDWPHTVTDPEVETLIV